MPEFQDTIQQLEEARQQYASAHSGYLQSREQLNKVRNQKEALLRKVSPNYDAYQKELSRLEALEKNASAAFEKNQYAFDDAKKRFGSIYTDFALRTDPRKEIAQKNDQIPFLLFPVRIETRFKKITRGNSVSDELWIRIYPDDCLVDTFEEMLSETEVKNAAIYWQQHWEAGGDENMERGAWRMLAGNHGSGRASYIIEQYTPLNSDDAPKKADKKDVVLVIASSQLPSDAEKTALETYWTTIWKIMGNAGKEQQAFAQLTADTGSSEAAENLITAYTPFNLSATPPAPYKKEEVAVSLAFLQLPDAASIITKSQSWSQAPSVNSLPEQFVVVGYEGDTIAFEKLLDPIPSPLFVAPDPGLKDEDQFSKDENGDIILPQELRWMTDFNVAIQNGLGVKIPVTAAQARTGFTRLVVLGIRLSADEEKGKTMVENLFDHHRKSRKGLALLQQGTPTNNTESESSGYNFFDDPDESFAALKKGKLFEIETDWKKKKDGQWLAECLGISYDAVNKISNSDLSDQAEARMMNTVLWPATQGYMMETLMQPVFKEPDITNTRNFFNEYVNGRGRIPAIKIGKQPYGILPTTDFGNIKWLNPRPQLRDTGIGYLQKLFALLKQMDEDWKPLLSKVSYIGKPGDAHQILLDALGLTPVSIEFYQRTAESKEDIFNRYNLLGLGGTIIALFLSAGYVQSGVSLLQKFGYTDADIPDILNKFFLTSQNLLKGALIDDRPLSETDKIRSYTADDKNYIQWLIEAAQTSHDALRKQQGFTDSKIPTALLYLVMHHALDLSYIEVSLRLFEKVNLLTNQQVASAKLEPAFLHIQTTAKTSESKWNYLYQKQPAITGNTDLLVGDYIPRIIKTEVASQYMKEQLEAMEYLKDLPTARLERLFAEHLDCCSYRLDAWKSGLINYQLAGMRGMLNNNNDTRESSTRSGIYIGAFGWVEHVKSENKVLTPVELEDEGLRKMFIEGQEIPLMRDSKNGGHITAPSLDHALTAAILRNGYTSNGNPDALRVNLSSERVRKALSAIEGIRQGQTLGALLGYYFERGLHEGYPGVELDYYIYQLRKAFPLTVNRIKDTAVDDTDSDSVETIEARNVIDGLSLIDHVTKTGITTYPFGKANLPPLDHPSAQSPAISKELDKIRDINDAVADLAISESVYQAVLANYERSNATLDTFSKGNFPATPEVIQTPRSGTNLTHRVGLHFKPGLTGNTSFTPRANAEPAINDWLQTMLPSTNNIVCTVSYGTIADEEVPASALGVQPIDLLYLINTDSDQALKEIDDRVLKFVMDKPGVRPDVTVSINYMKQVTGKYSFFEIASYIHSLQAILLRSRPLTPNDVSIAIEAKAQEDTAVFSDINKIRLDNACTTLKAVLDNELTNYITPLTSLMDDVETNHDAIIAALDVNIIAPLLPILDKLSLYGLPQTGFGFIYQTKKEIYKGLLDKVAALTAKWKNSLAGFDQAIADYDLLPPATTDEEKIQLLQAAELFISPVVRTTVPAIPNDYRDLLVTTTRANFVNTVNNFKAVATTANPTLYGLLMEIKTLEASIADIDADTFSLADNETQFIVFAEDLYTKATLLSNDLKSRLESAKTRSDSFDTISENAKKVSLMNDIVKLLFHEDFKIIPEFELTTAAGMEWNNAYGDTSQLLTYATQPNAEGVTLYDFPVDDWLYGVARVREKLHHWENITLLADAFKKNAPELHPLQLPYKTGDSWLALEYPADYDTTGDRLLYTAHYAMPFNKDARQCGILIDEWTEIIPSKEEDIGVTFHYDRPNAEPPQVILLAMPTGFTGSWQWQDLLNTVNETLNMAKRRAIEPAHVDTTSYARFLPALVSSMTVHPLTASLNFAFNNNLHEILNQKS
ncbi:MAG: hypothetical protein QM727_12100 [Niabella sp.]